MTLVDYQQHDILYPVICIASCGLIILISAIILDMLFSAPGLSEALIYKSLSKMTCKQLNSRISTVSKRLAQDQGYKGKSMFIVAMIYDLSKSFDKYYNKLTVPARKQIQKTLISC